MRATLVFIVVALVTGAMVLVGGCTVPLGSETTTRTSGMPAEDSVGGNLTIEQVLVQNGNFSTFLEAIERAGLKGAFTGPGPCTIFVPTDEVFAHLPDAVMEELFNDPKGNLAEVLLYHLAPGRYTISEITAAKTIPTVQGSPITVEATGGEVRLGGAKVVGSEILATNGIIYIIDAVMIPSEILLEAETAGAVVNITNTTNVTQEKTLELANFNSSPSSAEEINQSSEG